jgi:hypothetical protein
VDLDGSTTPPARCATARFVSVAEVLILITPSFANSLRQQNAGAAAMRLPRVVSYSRARVQLSGKVHLERLRKSVLLKATKPRV